MDKWVKALGYGAVVGSIIGTYMCMLMINTWLHAPHDITLSVKNITANGVLVTSPNFTVTVRTDIK